MNPPSPSTFPKLRRRFTQDMVNRYGRVNEDCNLIHYEIAAAQRAGFSRPIVHGAMVAALMSEACRDYFGRRWMEGGKLKVAFIKPVLVEQAVMTRAQITEQRPEDGGEHLHLDVWCENESGERVLVGEAICSLADD